MASRNGNYHANFLIIALTLLVGGRKGIRPVKKWWGCWCGCLSGARCGLAYGPADATIPLAVSCCSEIQIGFTFLSLDHLNSPRKGAVK